MATNIDDLVARLQQQKVAVGADHFNYSSYVLEFRAESYRARRVGPGSWCDKNVLPVFKRADADALFKLKETIRK